MLTSCVKGRIALVAAAAVLLAAAACGSDDDGGAGAMPTGDAAGTPLDAPTYFEQLSSAMADVNAGLPELQEVRAQVYTGAEVDAAAAADYGEGFLAYMEERESAISALTPPEELAGQHETLAEAAAGTVELAEQLNDALSSDPPATESAFADMYFDLDGTGKTQGFRDACTTLQRAAVDMDIAAGLQC